MTDEQKHVDGLTFVMAPIGHGSGRLMNKIVDDILLERSQMARKMNTFLIKPLSQTKGYKKPTPWPSK